MTNKSATPDHEAAKQWATPPTAFRSIGERNLAAAYLELRERHERLRELAKPFAHWPPEPPMAEKIAALLKVLEE